MFPGRQIKYNLLSIKECLNLFYLVVVFESLNSPPCEEMQLKLIGTALNMALGVS